jgi:hypothetical protein
MKIGVTNFLIGFLIIGFVLFGTMSFVQPLASPKNDTDFGGENTTLGLKFKNTINPIVNSTSEKLLGETGATPSIFDIVGFFINSVWTTITNILSSVLMIGELTTYATNDLAREGEFNGLAELSGLIIGIITILVVVGLGIYFLTGREV